MNSVPYALLRWESVCLEIEFDGICGCGCEKEENGKDEDRESGETESHGHFEKESPSRGGIKQVTVTLLLFGRVGEGQARADVAWCRFVDVSKRDILSSLLATKERLN